MHNLLSSTCLTRTDKATLLSEKWWQKYDRKNYVDLSDLYVDLSDLYVDLSDLYDELSDLYADLSDLFC